MAVFKKTPTRDCARHGDSAGGMFGTGGEKLREAAN